MYTIVNNKNALEAALKLCRGNYQHDFLHGYHNLSGSSLKGKAKRYGYRYKQSRINLLIRIDDAGIPVSEIKGSHNKRILVIGTQQ